MLPKNLQKYEEKRDFSKTPEPEPKLKKSKAGPIFVVQKHHASHLHYDFRLEIDGVLKSWAVPKGPSMDPHVKRLAAHVEDHPLDYATFEGIIPEGYGAGTVIVWDMGTFENATYKNGVLVPAEEAVEHGHIKVILHGKKLKGAFALTHFKDKNWLLVKVADEHADTQYDPVVTEPRSVLSKLTIEKLDKEFERLQN